jgi:diadenylate cyclase
MRDSATVRDVATVIQRMEMIRRITSEINGYLEELGSDGRLLALQVDDLVRGSASERALVLRDYVHTSSAVAAAESQLSELGGDQLIDLTAIANVLGLGVFDIADLDRIIQPRGIRALSLVPRLPWSVIKTIAENWDSLSELRAASVEDLQKIEGIGPYRAKLIHENLERQHAMAAAGVVGW